MRCLSQMVISTLLLAPLALLIGCDGKTPAPAKTEPAKSAATAGEDSETVGLAKLSAEDLKLVKLQDGKCPVSGEKLGSMGEPFKVVVKGRTVLLCCEGCKDDLLANPDKFLAKLPPAEPKK